MRQKIKDNTKGVYYVTRRGKPVILLLFVCLFNNNRLEGEFVMLIIGVALIVVFCFSIYGACHAPSWTVFKDLLCPMLVLLAGVGLLIYCVVLFQYTASEHRKNIINREYGTDYSQTEVFYASSVIETVRELDRKRVEINGDIVTGK